MNGSLVFKVPIPNFRSEAKKHIEEILVSYKAKNKVVTRNINMIKGKGKKDYKKVIQNTPRGQLHKETVYGKISRPMNKPVKLGPSFKLEQVERIINAREAELVMKHLEKYDNNPKKAFSSKTLKSDPIQLNGGDVLEHVACYEEVFTIRKAVAPDLKIDKVIDENVKKILYDRLEEYNNDPKMAFSNLDENPIWQNRDKGIAIKKVTITGISNAISLHYKKDHLGKFIKKDGLRIENDFVSTRNNHHIAIYEDKKGALQEKVVSFFEAVARVNQGLPIVDVNYNDHLGWKFLFTMKQNEMFVFPSADFDPSEIDLMNPENYSIISDNLFRVQKFSTKDYSFRHHLETTVNNNLDFTFKRITSLKGLQGCVKVRINHLGQISVYWRVLGYFRVFTSEPVNLYR